MEGLLDDLNIRCERDVPLGPRTWYGVGGATRLLAHPSSIQQLAALTTRCNQSRTPLYVLGSGANLLVLDQGVAGIVVQLDDPAFAQLHIENGKVKAGGGCDLAKLVLQTARAGLRGLEVMAGIPATVGGAVRMNAGGSFGEIGQCVSRVQVMDATGQVYYRDRDDLTFGYRKSNIVARFILEVEFELTPDDPETLMRQVKEIFAFKRNSQPLGARSAGCVFKNPRPRPDQAPVAPAGKLIDLAGLKGHRMGGAEVSTHHANFIVAHTGCLAADILALMEHVEKTVREKFGVALEREVVVWP